MASEFTIERLVEFSDTDMAGVVHFAQFFRYMEACETAFLRSLGLALIDETGAQRTGWPRVRASCEYRVPLRFGDTVEVRLAVKEIKPRALGYGFRFCKLTPGSPPVEVAIGELTVVCAELDDATHRMTSREIPAAVLAKLKIAPS
jgi:acyl-CoA thioester hydrolase